MGLIPPSGHHLIENNVSDVILLPVCLDSCGVDSQPRIKDAKRVSGQFVGADQFGRDKTRHATIGDDPDAPLALHPGLDIRDAYETIHLLLPDGSMKLGGEAVAEALRSCPTPNGLPGFRRQNI
jgi:hypothetical protein